jgi:hypothetical protein
MNKTVDLNVVAIIDLTNVSPSGLLYAYPQKTTDERVSLHSVVTALEEETGDRWNAEVMSIGNPEGSIELKLDWESWHNENVVEELMEDEIDEIEFWSNHGEAIEIAAARNMLINAEAVTLIV